MEWARLNVFQRLTRRWDALHPYNAAQAMKISGVADFATVEAAYQSSVGDLGLGITETKGNRFRWRPLSTSENIVVEQTTAASLDELMSAELNRPFDNNPQIPFRPFILQQDGFYYAVLVYHHWVADSFSIRLLMREWFLRIDHPSAARRNALKIATSGYWRLFGPDQACWTLDEAINGVFRWNSKFRRARRIDPRGFRELESHFSLYQADQGLITAVAAAAKRDGVTVNDVFLAAMAEVCDALVPVRRTARRPDIGLGTIADLRKHARHSMNDQFGLFLGFTSIFCRPADLADWDRLLARVHQQNQMQKASHAAESSMVRMTFGLLVESILNRRKLLGFYRKRLALAAGISNVNLSRDWPGKNRSSRLLDYIRVSPVGPIMPVVFTPTTIGDQLNLGLTCRGSVIPPEQAPQLAAMFLNRLARYSNWSKC